MKQSLIFRCATAALLITGLSANAGIISSELGILDLAANGGINPATGAAWQAGDTYRLAFVTSGTTLANSANIADYNQFVQDAAANSTGFSNLGDASWKVIGSTATTNVMANTGTNPASGVGEAVFLLNGSSVFANNYADLWNGANTSPNIRISITENGDARSGNYPNTPVWGSWTAVYTGSNNDGSTNADPLGGDGGGNVRHGLMQAEANFWIARSSQNGGTVALPVYALSDPLEIVPEPTSLALLGLGGLLIARRRRG